MTHNFEQATAKGVLPTLSVVVPTFNAGTFIAATLESIRRQEVPGVEVILADGGSTDDTVAVARAVGLENLRVISNRDHGQLDALQKGLALATGDVVVWINGDDIVMPEAFTTALTVFRDHADVDFVFADDAAFDETAQGFYYGSTIRGLNDWDHLLFYRQMYSECVYWRREVTRLLSPEYYDLRVYTDYAFFLNLRWGRKGHWVPQRLGAFRIRQDQASAAFAERKVQEFARIRGEHAKRIGLHPYWLFIARIIYWPWFVLRQKLRPTIERGIRRIYRFLTRDRHRKIETQWFFSEWLKPAQ